MVTLVRSFSISSILLIRHNLWLPAAAKPAKAEEPKKAAAPKVKEGGVKKVKAAKPAKPAKGKLLTCPWGATAGYFGCCDAGTIFVVRMLFSDESTWEIYANSVLCYAVATEAKLKAAPKAKAAKPAKAKAATKA